MTVHTLAEGTFVGGIKHTNEGGCQLSPLSATTPDGRHMAERKRGPLGSRVSIGSGL